MDNLVDMDDLLETVRMLQDQRTKVQRLQREIDLAQEYPIRDALRSVYGDMRARLCELQMSVAKSGIDPARV